MTWLWDTSVPRKLLRFIAGILIVGLSAAAAGEMPLRQFVPYTLQPGVNRIASLSKQITDAEILLEWHQGERGPNSWHVFMVLVKLRDGGGWQIAWIYRRSGRDDTVADEPFDGEMVVKSVRFGKAIVAGVQTNVLIEATREINGPYGNPSPVRFDISKLVVDNDFDEASFEPVEEIISKKKYCSAEMAMYRELAIPLRHSYAGVQNQSGCPS